MLTRITISKYETALFPMSEECRLKMFGNRILRGMFWPKRYKNEE